MCWTRRRGGWRRFARGWQAAIDDYRCAAEFADKQVREIRGRMLASLMIMIRTIAFLALAATGPSPDASQRQNMLMDEIERTVALPKGARPFGAYAHNYAFNGADKVRAIYLVPEPPLKLNDGCEELLEHGRARPCRQRELQRMAREDRRRIATQTPAGQRRWYKDKRAMPEINDGGCMQVTIEYDIRAHRASYVGCNGYA
jgi:hypothetical protein